MTKAILSLLLAIVITPMTCAQLRLGTGISYFDSQAGLQMRALGTLDRGVAGQTAFSYYLRDNGSLWSLDMDVLFMQVRRKSLNPNALRLIGGLRFLGGSFAGDRDVTILINLGLHGLTSLTAHQDLFVEPKIVLGLGGASFSISAGLYF